MHAVGTIIADHDRVRARLKGSQEQIEAYTRLTTKGTSSLIGNRIARDTAHDCLVTAIPPHDDDLKPARESKRLAASGGPPLCDKLSASPVNRAQTVLCGHGTVDADAFETVADHLHPLHGQLAAVEAETLFPGSQPCTDKKHGEHCFFLRAISVYNLLDFSQPPRDTGERRYSGAASKELQF